MLLLYIVLLFVFYSNYAFIVSDIYYIVHLLMKWEFLHPRELL